MFNLFKKNKQSLDDSFEYTETTQIIDLRSSEIPEIKEVQDEWVEIIGYKGMDENMRCRDGFQYKLGNTYMIADPSTVKACKNGYHLCKLPEETFCYYNDFLRNRYFKVRAIVRKEDLDKYDGKIAAKEIEILEELTTENVYELIGQSRNIRVNSMTLDDFRRFRFMSNTEIQTIMTLESIQKLQDLGYSKTFSILLMSNIEFIAQSTITTGYCIYSYSTFSYKQFEELYTKAKAFKEEGLSPDMCAYLLLK